MTRRCLGCRRQIARGSYCIPCQRTRQARYHSPEYLGNRAQALAASGGRCQCPGCGVCNGNCDRPGNTADHITPLDRGGTHATANLRATCGPCNSSKRNR